MSELFLKIVNMSISASWLVLVVLAFRFLFRKAPKWVNVLLWGIVAVRLICPFSIESALSLIPSAETISPEIMMDWTPEISTGIESVDRVVNPIITETFAPEPIASANPLQILIPIFSAVWLIGVAAFVIYTAISYWRLQRKVSEAVILRDNIFQSENVSSPFVLGIIKPKIYLPYHMDDQDLEHVVAHEHAHIRRRDHWWKPLGFLLLTIHWFNPLMWVAYILLCRDIELACDEKVIKEMGNEQRADYTQALVSCSVSRRMIAACPLAFGEVCVKERVKSVMNYKKPAFWIIVLSVVTCLVVALCFLTNPKERVRDIMTPGTAWGSEEYQLFFAVNENNVIEGIFTNQDETTTISVGYRFAGKYNAVFDIYRGDWEWAQKSAEAPLLSGILKAQKGTLILEVEKDNIGLGAKQIGFSKTDAKPSDMNSEVLGKTYTYEKEGIMGDFTITLFDDGTFSYYEGMASSYLGFGSWKQDGDIITMTNDGHGGLGPVNHFKFDKTDLLFVEEGSSNFIYVKVQDGERFFYMGEAVKPQDAVQPEARQTLSLNDVIMLSQKGYDLTWDDFDQYRYIETGSGLYIRFYEINEMFSLWIGGFGLDSDPMYIYLSLADDLDTRIDIRDGGVTEFIGKDHSETLLNRAIYDAILNCNLSEKTFGLNNCASFIMLDKEEISGTPVVGSTDHVGMVTVYGLALYQGYDMVDGKLHEEAGSHSPVAITFDVLNGKYSLKEYWRPGDGTYYAPAIREKFPDHIEDEAMNTQKYIAAQKQECYVQAMRNNGVDINAEVEQLFEEIESAPLYSSRPADYIDAHPEAYQKLIWYGQHTLQYCFEQFLRGGQTGLRGHLMRAILDELAPEAQLRLYAMTGQEYFDEWKAGAIRISEQHDMAWIKEKQPAIYLLLQMTDD